jgi:hypothetical protein
MTGSWLDAGKDSMYVWYRVVSSMSIHALSIEAAVNYSKEKIILTGTCDDKHYFFIQQ